MSFVFFCFVLARFFLLYLQDADFEVEMVYIKEKVDAGADLIITQMFFDSAVYISYVKACRDRLGREL